MSNRAWQRRRTKQGLAARQFAAISRAMRRDRGKPLPRTWVSKGTGLTLTVTAAPPGHTWEDEAWHDDEQLDPLEQLQEGVLDALWDDEEDYPHDGTQ